MSKSRLIKMLCLMGAALLCARQTGALPDYMKIYNADPFAKAEFKGKCSTCHLNPAGGGERNEFGKSFARAGYRITAEMRQQFPDRFGSSAQPPVTFTSDSEAVVEINGKRYAINTRDKTVKELIAPAAPAATAPAPAPAAARKNDNAYESVDVRLINLPTAIDIPKGSLWTDFTHRFPFGEPTNARGLFGLDSFAYPSFGVIYGVTDWLQIGAYRSPGDLGRAIQVHAGVSLLKESKGQPLNLTVRAALEGRDNFQRNFAGSFEFAFARSLTRHAQFYFVPTVTVGDRPFSGNPASNLPGETAAALGVGLAVNLRPSMALMAEANYRVNEAGRYQDPNTGLGIRRPVVGFGIQKASASRRHAFSLVFSNGPGTTISQRSITRGLIGADDTLRGLTIGFNLSRRIF